MTEQEEMRERMADFVGYVQADKVIKLLANRGYGFTGRAGYCKLPRDKPPLLRDWEMDLIILDPDMINTPKVYYNLCQAQREADIKHYEGGE